MRLFSHALWFVLLITNLVGGVSFVRAADLSESLKKLRDVGPKGTGTAEAAAAWRELSQSDPTRVPEMLAALDGANPLAANWIRAAVDAICERSLKAGTLPRDALEKFVLDTKQDPRGRRLAYEWLLRGDKGAAERLLPKMLNDPSLELRRDSVAEAIASADQLANSADQKGAAITAYQTAFDAARDADQVKSLAAKLTSLGQKVDVPVHYGFIQHWKLIGPFDNTNKKGFATRHPPESPGFHFDPTKELPGKSGPLKWIDYTTDDEFGVVNLNVAISKQMGAVAYAYLEFTVPEDRDAEIRLGSNNANKAWLNGELLFESEAYHTAFEIDQYVGRSRLHAGKNVVLVKICQNEQTEVWAQEWRFQLRVCDKLGTAILSTDRPPTPVKQVKAAKNANAK